MQKVLDITAEYADLTNQTLHVGKSYCWGTDRHADIKLFYKGTRLKRLHEAILVGARIRFDDTSPDRNGKIQQKIDGKFADAHRFLERAAHLPFPLKVKERVIAAGALAGPMYGCEVTTHVPETLRGLGKKVANCLMPKHHRRCSEILLTLFARGHMVDPWQIVIFKTLNALRRMLSRRPEMMDLFQEVFQLRRADPRKEEDKTKKESPYCPWCSTPDLPVVEDIFHRIWVCPRWELCRVALPVAGICAAARAGKLPRCLAYCGLCPRLMLSIAECRSAARLLQLRRERDAADDKPTRAPPNVVARRAEMYLWKWAPASARAQPPKFLEKLKVTRVDCGMSVRDKDKDGVLRWRPVRRGENRKDQQNRTNDRVHFRYGATMWTAMCHWLGQLRWPAEKEPHANDGVSFLELAIDFECATGINIPPVQRAMKAAGVQIKGFTQYIQLADAWARDAVLRGEDKQLSFQRGVHERAELLSVMWECIQKWASAPLAPGRRYQHADAWRGGPGLAALGLVNRSNAIIGWSRRPVFACPAETEAVLRTMCDTEDWHRASGKWQPDYAPFQQLRRQRRARFSDLTGVTNDPDLTPPAPPSRAAD
eukprot:gene4087-8877_t